MQRYFIKIDNETGENCGFYVTGTWEYNDIINQCLDGQSLKEISKELWNVLLGNNEDIKLNSPVLKLDKIEKFLKTDFLNIIDLHQVFFDLFMEQEIEPILHELTQQEKDIKVLAEALKTLIEPMIIPKDNYSNQILEKLQEIINRYTIN